MARLANNYPEEDCVFPPARRDTISITHTRASIMTFLCLAQNWQNDIWESLSQICGCRAVKQPAEVLNVNARPMAAHRHESRRLRLREVVKPNRQFPLPVFFPSQLRYCRPAIWPLLNHMSPPRRSGGRKPKNFRRIWRRPVGCL
jgi:hypothetical protein